MAKRIKKIQGDVMKIRKVGAITSRSELLLEDIESIRRDVADFRELAALNWDAAMANRTRRPKLGCNHSRWVL